MNNITTVVWTGLLIFVEVLQMLIIADIVLSWLRLVGLTWRPKFLADIIDPTYKFIRSIIPTRFWPLDFNPIVVILFLIFIEILLYGFFPDLSAINLSLR